MSTLFIIKAVYQYCDCMCSEKCSTSLVFVYAHKVYRSTFAFVFLRCTACNWYDFS